MAVIFSIGESHPKSQRDKTRGNTISFYVAGGVAQRDEDVGTKSLFGTFSGVIDFEHQFNEMHGVTGGIDFFYDNRLRELQASERSQVGAHMGYDFKFYKFAVKFQKN